MNFKRTETFIIVVIIAMFGVIYAFTQQPVKVPVTESSSLVRIEVVEYKGLDGKTAMEILKSTHQVDVKSFSFGEMVETIDGVKPDDKHFWAMYVNGAFSQVGADQYVTKNSDIIKWQIDEIKF